MAYAIGYHRVLLSVSRGRPTTSVGISILAVGVATGLYCPAQSPLEQGDRARKTPEARCVKDHEAGVTLPAEDSVTRQHRRQTGIFPAI
jgi:hypothetical protein